MLSRRQGILLALGIALLAWIAFPFVDPRVPFRFERFDGRFGWGPVSVQGATSAFIAAFPPGTSIAAIREFFGKIGGQCYPPTIDHPDRIDCFYEHSMAPCMARGWWAAIDFDAVTKTSISVKVGQGIDGC